MRILVTGGLGYLGGRFARFIASRPDHEIFLGTRKSVAPPVWLTRGEIARIQWENPDALGRICENKDVIVHMAGMNAQDCAADPVTALDFNAVATASLLQAAIDCRVKRFIYISTAHVYGNPLNGSITEDTCPISLHPYASSHRAGEDVVRHAHERGDIIGIVLRLSNSYGAPIDKNVNCWMLLANDLCYQAVTEQHLILRTSGLQRRDFVTITDVCRMVEHFLDLSESKLSNGVFNAGSGWAPTILEFTRYIADRVDAITGIRPVIKTEQTGKEDEREKFTYDISKLLGTGFSLNKDEYINSELDDLIHFCIKYFS